MVELKEMKSMPALMRWREEVMEHVFGEKPEKRLLVANRRYYAAHISDGSHLAFVAMLDGNDAGCGAICFSEELPSPDNPSGRCAYLMNIYVREEYRDRGVAHHVVARLIEEAKKHGCDKIYLETTSDGRHVYQSLGFRDMPDMMKYSDSTYL